MHKYILSIGTNMGERLDNLSSAVRLLSRRGELLSISSVYETSPVGMDCDDTFLNLALLYRTYLPPREMLDFGKYIEARMGRIITDKTSSRPIDIDLIHWSGGTWKDENLVIPHPEAEQRAFVIIPVNEIIPEKFPVPDFKDQKIIHFCEPDILFVMHQESGVDK